MGVVFAYGLYRRFLLWMMGKPEKRTDQPRERLISVWAYVMGHKRMLRDTFPGWMHLLKFYGFLVPFVVVVITQAAFSLPRILALPLSMFFDLIGTLGIVGLLMAAYRRYVQKPENLAYDTHWSNAVALLLLLGIFGLGFCVEGLRITRTQPDWVAWSPVGWLFSKGFSGLSDTNQILLHRLLWRLHLFLVLGFIAFIPYSRMLHIVTGPANVYMRSLGPKGELPPIRDFETAETFGASKIEELTRKQLFDFDACTRCGRCLDHLGGLYIISIKAGLPFQTSLENSSLIEKPEMINDVMVSDEILRIDGHPFSKWEEIELYLDGKRNGEDIYLELKRNGSNNLVAIKLTNYYSLFDLIIISFVGLTFFGMGVFVRLKAPGNKSAQLFHWASVGLGAVIVITPGYYNIEPSGYGHFNRIFWLFVYSITPVLFIHFTSSFSKRKVKGIKPILFYFYVSAIINALILSYLFLDATLGENFESLKYYVTFFDSFFRIFLITCIIISISICIYAYRSTSEIEERKRLQWLLLGFFIGPFSFAALRQLRGPVSVALPPQV